MSTKKNTNPKGNIVPLSGDYGSSAEIFFSDIDWFECDLGLEYRTQLGLCEVEGSIFREYLFYLEDILPDAHSDFLFLPRVESEDGITPYYMPFNRVRDLWIGTEILPKV